MDHRQGVGFGLGVAVVDEPAKAKRVCSKGEFYWVRRSQRSAFSAVAHGQHSWAVTPMGPQVGAASTTFWVDVQEGIVVIFLSQLLPWTQYNYMRELRGAVNQALADAPRWGRL